MMTAEGWRDLSVSEFAEIVGGTTPSTSNPSNFGGEIPWITPRDLSDHQGRYISRGDRNITKQGMEEARLRLLPTGTVLLTTRAPIGYVAIARNPVTTNQGFRSLIVKRGFVPEFVYYLLRHDTERLRAFASGTTFGELAGSTLAKLHYRLPAEAEQHAIVRVLGSLDGKIELNRQTNQTLEQIAKALFKSWFVDFEPVRAKAEGRWRKGDSPPGMPADAWDLWPNEFEESEIGEIPKGWHVRGLGESLDVIETGSRPPGGVGRYTDGVPSVGAESILGIGVFDFSKTKFVPSEFYERMLRGKVESRDVLLYKDGGRPGEYEPHVSLFGDGFPFGRFCINEHVYRLRTRPPVSQVYLYLWLTSEDSMEEMRQRGTGVAVPGLNSTAVRSLSILIPPPELSAVFEGIVEPLVARILLNASESVALTRMRDVLLPRLLSGEVRVPVNRET